MSDKTRPNDTQANNKLEVRTQARLQTTLQETRKDEERVRRILEMRGLERRAQAGGGK